MFSGCRDVTLIGEGGLGRVYRAVKESTGGVVAIKELHEVAFASPAWHRARRELDALLRLKGHPYVVSVEEIIAGPNGPCLVMEYAPGGSLATRVTNGPLTVGELVLAGLHVTSAIAAAHEMGIVHRDIKPHNLLVGSFGQVKVADFGIAALTRDAGPRTQTHAFTLAYASPEELDGDGKVGTPADVYSFAATMAHLGTGRKPSLRNGAGLNDLGEVSLRHQALRAAFEQVSLGLDHDPSSRPTMLSLHAAFNEASSLLGSEACSKFPPGVLHTPHAEPLRATPPPPPVIDQQPTPLAATTITARVTTTSADHTIWRDSPTLSELPPPPPPISSAPARPDFTYPVAPRRSGRTAGIIAVLAVGAAAAAAAIVLSVSGNKSDDNRDITAGDEESVNGSTGNGSTGNTSTGNTSTGNGSTGNGSTGNGSTGNGSTGNGSTGNGSTGNPQGVRPAVPSGEAIAPGAVVRSAAYSPDGTEVVTASLNGTAQVWNARTGDWLYELWRDPNGKFIYSARYSRDGSKIVVTSQDRTAIIFNAATGQQIGVLRGTRQSLFSAEWDPSGLRIVTSSYENDVRVWDATTYQQIGTLVGHTDTVWSAAFSSDGSMIVTAGKDGTIRIWDSYTMAQLGSSMVAPLGGVGSVHSAYFSNDDRWIVTSHYQYQEGTDALKVPGYALVWNVQSRQVVRTFAGHIDGVMMATFNSDGSRIVTASSDGTAIVWDVDSEQKISEVLDSGMPTNSAFFSPVDDNEIVTGGANDAQVWRF